MVPPTLLMGASFPYLQRINQTSLGDIGKRGWCITQAANILGSTLGAIMVGLVFLHYVGSAGTLKILLLLGVAYWFLLARICTGKLQGKAWLR